MMTKNVAASLSVVAGLCCIGGALRGGGGDHVEAVEHGPASPASPAVVSAPSKAIASPQARLAETVAIDTSLPTGSIGRGSALHTPNPAAYADAAKNGSSLILTGAEAINYLAGNTLRREGPAEPLHYTYFASRGLQGEGSERSFVARPWDRNASTLCDSGPDGGALCRRIEILLDAKSEFAGARLATVTIGGRPAGVLIKGNILKFPEHIPYLDSAVATEPGVGKAVAGAVEATGKEGPAAWAGIVGHAAAVGRETDAARRVVYYGADNRMLDVQTIGTSPDGGKAVKITVGHWRTSKALVCETHVIGDAAQTCFKPEPTPDGSVRLVPVGKGGEAQLVTPLVETGSREVAQD